MANPVTRARYMNVTAAGFVASVAFVVLLWNAVKLDSIKKKTEYKTDIPGTEKPNTFHWHPHLMAIGFGGMLTTPALAFVRLRRPRLHMLTQVVSLAFALVGLLVAFAHKASLGKPHLATWHAQLGALTLVLFVATAAVGSTAMLLWKLKVWHRPAFLRNGVLRRLHLRMGAVTQTAAAGTILLGLESTYARNALRLLPYGDSELMHSLVSLMSLLPTASILYYLWLRRYASLKNQ